MIFKFIYFFIIYTNFIGEYRRRVSLIFKVYLLHFKYH
jgi:hypothetical protein